MVQHFYNLQFLFRESFSNSDENGRFRCSLRSLPNGTGHHGIHDGLDRPEAIEEENIMKKMLQVNLLKDPVFILFSISNFCTSIGFNVPLVYIVKAAEDAKIFYPKPAYLLSVIGLANTLGRIVLGYLSDKPWINRLLVYNLCLTVCGVGT